MERLSDRYNNTFTFDMAYPSHRGFVALISMIMLSVMLFLTTLSLAQFGLANRSFILDLENKARSKKLAEACAHISRVLIYNNPQYAENTRTFPIGTESCTLVSAVPLAQSTEIKVQGKIRTSVTNLRITVDHESGAFLSWVEVSKF